MDRCIAKISDYTGFHFHRCKNRAKFGNYCGLHAPEKRKERRANNPSKSMREFEYHVALDSLINEVKKIIDLNKYPELQKVYLEFENKKRKLNYV